MPHVSLVMLTMRKDKEAHDLRFQIADMRTKLDLLNYRLQNGEPKSTPQKAAPTPPSAPAPGPKSADQETPPAPTRTPPTNKDANSNGKRSRWSEAAGLQPSKQARIESTKPEAVTGFVALPPLPGVVVKGGRQGGGGNVGTGPAAGEFQGTKTAQMCS